MSRGAAPHRDRDEVSEVLAPGSTEPKPKIPEDYNRDRLTREDLERFVRRQAD